MSSMTAVSPEEVLGIEPGATREEVDAARRRLARRTHPDAGGTVGLFRQIQAAYEALTGSASEPSTGTEPPASDGRGSEPSRPPGHEEVAEATGIAIFMAGLVVFATWIAVDSWLVAWVAQPLLVAGLLELAIVTTDFVAAAGRWRTGRALAAASTIATLGALAAIGWTGALTVATVAVAAVMLPRVALAAVRAHRAGPAC